MVALVVVACRCFCCRAGKHDQRRHNEVGAQEVEDAERDAEEGALVRAAEAQADSIEGATDKLGAAPKTIPDKYSSVLGDSFHGMDRPKVSIHHDHKKGYFVALRRAWFVFDPVKLRELKGHLRSDGLSDEEIKPKSTMTSNISAIGFRDGPQAEHSVSPSPCSLRSVWQ